MVKTIKDRCIYGKDTYVNHINLDIESSLYTYIYCTVLHLITLTFSNLYGIRAVAPKNLTFLLQKFRLLFSSTMVSPNNSTTFTEIINTNPNNQTILNINMSNVSKLSTTNYLMWSLQVHALIDGYGLIGHLDGSTVTPPSAVTVDGETNPNPDYTIWKRSIDL